MAKVGRKPLDRDEIRKNCINVPMRSVEKQRIKEEASRLGVSNAAFLRMLASNYFGKNE